MRTVADAATCGYAVNVIALGLPCLVLLLATCSTAEQVIARSGSYSLNASNIWGLRTGVIPSPDHGKRITVLPPRPSGSDDETHHVIVEAFGRVYDTDIGALVNAEAVWSPDSQAFFLTYSDGGNVGTYHAKVVYVTASGLRTIEPILNGRDLLSPLCFDLESPNLAAIKWVGEDASRLLIAAQVPPHSSCAAMGTFRVFEIALPGGTVIASHGQIAAKKIYARDLGPALRKAEDSCVRQPSKCSPPGLVAPKNPQ